MKILLTIILIVGCLFTLFSCESISNSSVPVQSIQRTETLYEWGEYSIPPSYLEERWKEDPIMRTVPYKDGARIIVLWDVKIMADSDYYYVILLQDFGWYRSMDGNWKGNGYSRRTNEGSMYVNPKLGVAIYFYPGKNTYDVFRAKIIRE